MLRIKRDQREIQYFYLDNPGAGAHPYAIWRGVIAVKGEMTTLVNWPRCQGIVGRKWNLFEWKERLSPFKEDIDPCWEKIARNAFGLS